MNRTQRATTQSGPRRAAAAALAVLLLTAATGAQTSNAVPAPSPADSPTSTTCARLKPYLAGPLDRQYNLISGRNTATADDVTGFVIEVPWSQLEPTRGDFDFRTIDTQLRFARAHALRVKLRVLAGDQAPPWAKAIGGAPFSIYDHQRHQVATLGRFWLPAYQQAWQQLQTALAGRYDTDPDVAEVNISGTGVISAEVMLLFLHDHLPGGRTNRAQYQAAGFTDASRDTALRGDVTFMQATWEHTALDLFAHPYQTLTQRGGLPTTEQLITATYDADPGHVVFSHTGLAQNIITGASHQQALTMYRFITAQGYPFDVQTETNKGIGDPGAVLRWAAQNRVMSVELPAVWQHWAALQPLLTGARTALKRNTQNQTSTLTARAAGTTGSCDAIAEPAPAPTPKTPTPTLTDPPCPPLPWTADLVACPMTESPAASGTGATLLAGLR